MTGLGPFLYKLPTELRLMILGDCIAAGHPAFMRASRALHMDGEAIVFEKGICRMHLGYPYKHCVHQPHQKTIGKIQTLDVTVDMTEWWGCYGGYADIFEPFADLDIRRGHCNLLFKVDYITKIFIAIDLLEPVWRFAGFREIGWRVEICSRSGERLLDNEDERYMRKFITERFYGKVEIVKAGGCYRIIIDPREQAEVIAGVVEG